MTQIAEQLLEKAAHYQELSDDETTVQSAAIAVLVSRGVELEKAAEAVTAEFDSSQASVYAEVADVLTKVAEYIQDLEAQVETLASALPIEKSAEQNEAVERLHSYGMSEEDIHALPESMLHKVASMVSAPASMGEGYGMAVDKTDPFTAFLMS